MTYRGFYNTMHQVWIRTDAFSCLLKLPSSDAIILKGKFHPHTTDEKLC